jgi:hypothetical protein
MNRTDLLGRLRRIILHLFPELAGTHLPLKARVLKLNSAAGRVGVADGPRRYSVDVKPLHPEGNEDEGRPVIRDVPIDVPTSGPLRGVFALPAVGSIVRIGFYGGSAAHPYVDGVIPDGWEVPAIEEGEVLVQHRDGTKWRFDGDGNLTIQLAEVGGKGGNLSLGLSSTQGERANISVSASDAGAGANLTITLDAPSGGALSIVCKGNAQIQTEKDANILASGKVNLGGIDGKAIARDGDSVVNGVIVATSQKGFCT